MTGNVETKKRWLISTIVIVLSLLIGFKIGFIFGNYKRVINLPTLNVPSRQISDHYVVPIGDHPAPIPTATNVDTSQWPTYRNEEYGFALKYPPDWGVKYLPARDKDETIFGFTPQPMDFLFIIDVKKDSEAQYFIALDGATKSPGFIKTKINNRDVWLDTVVNEDNNGSLSRSYYLNNNSRHSAIRLLGDQVPTEIAINTLELF